MVTETWVILQRQMRILLRNPVWVFFGLTQPILYLVLFGPLLKGVVLVTLGTLLIFFALLFADVAYR